LRFFSKKEEKKGFYESSLTRDVNGAMRIYRLEVLPNLFGEWVVVRSFGSLKNNMRQILRVYQTFTQAQSSYEELLMQKMKKGYAPIN
jgi:predicted DNA-binding WGR domain protein